MTSSTLLALAEQGLDLESVSREYVLAVYRRVGTIAGAARVLGIHKNTVYRYLGRPVDKSMGAE